MADSFQMGRRAIDLFVILLVTAPTSEVWADRLDVSFAMAIPTLNVWATCSLVTCLVALPAFQTGTVCFSVA